MSNLRCQPGDLALVVRSASQNNLGKLVLVEKYHPDLDRWEVRLLGGHQFGTGLKSGAPMFSDRVGFRDSSLHPLRGGGEVLQEMPAEADYV
ncbi:hypothetical protein C7410_10836 [Paraburkholderia silvatlantica]|uniref:Uncharacterized protein n=1 Tax=Paraburkholderia silvatlantica TaxID=321895 RepID=A0A2V4TH93_9BURK|nr:hypothetical protein [Paraburkholderia silvatlantica]PYE23141.1 hypothetical protein C7410_10836 [Paraburkholderia silvatlantica]